MMDDIPTRLPADLLQTFDAIAELETRAIKAAVDQKMAAVVADCARRGMLSSSVAQLLVAKEAANSVQTVAMVTFQQLVRCIHLYKLTVNEGIKAEAELILAELVERYRGQMKQQVMDSAPMRSMPPIAGVTQPIDLAAGDRIAWIKAELSLLVASSRPAIAESNSNPSMVFHGPVGVVQTGASSSVGVVNQHIDAQSKEVLLAALEKLLEALPRGGAGEHDEVRDAASEVKDELNKPKPSVIKVKGCLTGIGQAIAFTPHLKEAYDNLKWAAAWIGITLP